MQNMIQRINVGDSLTRSAALRPARPAVVDGDRRWTYAELNAWVNRLAHGYARGGAMNPYSLRKTLRALEIAGSTGCRWSTSSVLAGKATAYLSAQYPREQAYARAERIWEPVYSSEDAQEGPRAFRDGRAPVWKGR